MGNSKKTPYSYYIDGIEAWEEQEDIVVAYDPSMHLIVCLERKEQQYFENKANSYQQIMFNGILFFSFWCREEFVNEAESIFRLFRIPIITQ